MTYNLKTIILIERFQDEHDEDFGTILDEVLSIIVPTNITIQDWLNHNRIAIPKSNDEKQILALELIEGYSFQIERYFENRNAPPEIGDFDMVGEI